MSLIDFMTAVVSLVSAVLGVIVAWYTYRTITRKPPRPKRRKRKEPPASSSEA